MKRQAWIVSTAFVTLLMGCTQPPALVEYKGDQFYGRASAMLDRSSSSVSYGSSYREQSSEDSATYQAVSVRSVDITPLTSDAAPASHMPMGVSSRELSAPVMPAAQQQPFAPVVQQQPAVQPVVRPLNGFSAPQPVSAPRYKPVSNPDGQVHKLQKGETLYRLSKQYNVPVEAIKQANAIQSESGLQLGQAIKIPSGSTQLAAIAPAAAPAKPVPLAAVTPAPMPVKPAQVAAAPVKQVDVPVKAPAPQMAAPTAPSAPVPEVRQVALKTTASPAAAERFIWPVQGKVITGFGQQPGGVSNDGINIQARAGTPVKATAEGTVVHVGDALPGYGKLVIVRHADGWLSAYAHNAETFVKKDQKVRQGQTIASVGASGKVTEPQLHFSLRQGKSARNPLDMLEQTTADVAQSQQL